MGKHSIIMMSQGHPKVAATVIRRTRTRPAFLIPLASAITLALVLVIVVDPYSGTYANAAPPQQWSAPAATETQTVVAAGDYETTATRDSYSVTEPPPPPPPVVVAATQAKSASSSASSAAPAAGTPDPGSAKAVAREMVAARGWDEGQYNCLVSLWNKESGWNVFAANKSSGAYGIPQALPGSKMASAGGDWSTSAATQITWGLGYITGRYQTPCGAWTHSQALGWY